MKIVTNNMAIIIVIRIRGIWLFNLTLSHNLFNGVTRMLRYSFRLAFFILALSPLFVLVGCDTPVSPERSQGQKDKIAITSVKYISDSLSIKTCYTPNDSTGNDSLKVNGSKYTISARSRYRMETLPHDYLDSLADVKGIYNANWAIYKDTKRDSIYLFPDCLSLKDYKGDF